MCAGCSTHPRALPARPNPLPIFVLLGLEEATRKLFPEGPCSPVRTTDKGRETTNRGGGGILWERVEEKILYLVLSGLNAKLEGRRLGCGSMDRRLS